MEGTAVAWPTWHNAEQDASTREQVIRAVYTLFTRRSKPELQGQIQQHKLPDFIRRLEESLYKMARSREEYADLSTLELRLQQVVNHIVRKPVSGRGTSQKSDGGGESVAQQLAGGGDAFTPNSHHRQQAQQAALYAAQQQQQSQQQHAHQQHHQQQQQQQQQQMVPQGMMPVANGGLNWLDGGAGGAGAGGMGMGMVPQQGAQQQGAQQQVPNGAGNQLAVAGAPAGQSTAESAQRGATGNSGGIDFSSLAAGGGDVTSGLSMPAGSGLQQQGAAPPGGMQQAGGTLGRLGALNSSYMSMANGAPVLLRGAGGGDGGGGMVPMAGLVPSSANSMMPLASGASNLGNLGMMPTSQAPLSGLGGTSMLPGVKIEPGGGGGMVPVGGGAGAGMMPLGGGGSMVPVGGGSAGGMLPQLPGLPQQQHGNLQPPSGLGEQQGGMQQLGRAGTAGMMGAGGFTGMLMGSSNGYGNSGLLPVGTGAQQPGLQQQQVQQQWGLQQAGGQPAGTASLLQQQQALQHQPGAFGQPGAAAALPLMQQQQPGLAAAGGITGLPAIDGIKQEAQPALPSFNTDADHSFNLLGNAFSDVGGAMGGGGDARKQQILKQQRWLLFLRHCARCQLPEGQCQYGRNCTVAKQLWQHLVNCKETNCGYPRCNPSRELLRHHQKCSSPNCPVCAPVKQYVSKQRQLVFHRKTATLTPELRQNLLLHLQQNPRAREVFQVKHGVDANTIFAMLDPGAGASNASVMTSAGVPPGGAAMQPGGMPQQQQLPQAMQAPLMQQQQQQPLPSLAAALNAPAGGAGALAASRMPGAAAAAAQGGVGLHAVGGAGYGAPPGMQPQQQQAGMVPTGAGGAYGTLDSNALAAAPKRQRTRVAQESCGTSLLEFFTEQQIETHVLKLRSKDPALMQIKGVPKQQPGFDPFRQELESNCKVCELNRLTFEPPSLYCFSCGQRIKRNQVYYGTPSNHEIKGVWCHPCHQDIKTETVPLDGFNIRKAELEKRKNDDEVEEGWVQCDQCEGWVHQVCGLFNKGRNDQNRGFLCPFCLRDGLRAGERRIPGERPQAMLTARDLPSCDLSDHLERRLDRVLREERLQRAAMEGRHPSEVRTAEGLTVRVVNNVVKRNDVRQRLYNLVKGERYPEAFMYKQKVILLFQNIDGVDLCLYCMYMQEYGDDVPAPNRKSVYLSYLDSVKYFQPEDVTAAGRGVALRTMVYHEMLLGYLEYVKARGFEMMFIWACPPLAGDDYILYCHPGKQKTPRSDRLREWYLTMLNRAKEEGTVTYISNMWDTYFEGGRDHRLDRISITQLPYYDGDYWPGEAENLLASISTEAQQGGKGGKPAIKTTSSSRSKPLKAKRVGAGAGSIAEELLSRLGETIQGMREDFIVVHLQEPCSFCREYMSEGVRYYHPSPPQKVVVRSERTFDGISLDKPGSDATRTVTYTRFALCTRCYSAECAGHGKGLPAGMQIGELLPARNPRIPATVDTVQEMENEFFDTRTAFLSLCQGNHYQFDSLRRAKHSSMMVLYHLHNPTAPAFSCTCNVCNKEIQSGDGWRCGTCPDFDMCNACFLNPAVPRHQHQLVRHARDIDERRSRLTQEQLSARNQYLHRTMQVLLHASSCTDQNCPSNSCTRVKAMFHHAMTCSIKLAGNCQYCRRMFMLLQMHATHCTVPNCQVPRCTQLREMRRRQATRAEDKRRAAYRTMLRQQAGG